MTIEFFKEDEIIFHISNNIFLSLDTIGEKFYIIMEGQVGVLVPRIPGIFSDLYKIKSLHKGYSFGELALINDKPRMATIKCLKKSILLVFDRKAFNKVIRQRAAESINKELNYFKTRPFLKKIK